MALRKGFGANSIYPDECLKALVHWIFSTFDMDSIGRLWIQEYYLPKFEEQLVTSSVKSILLGRDSVDSDLKLVHDRFRLLEHLGGIEFSELAYLQDLRYVRGRCFGSEFEVYEVRTSVFHKFFKMKESSLKSVLGFTEIG